MFQVLALQRIYSLSDDKTEHQINDRMNFMRFWGLGLEDRVPDAKIIWLFCNTLARPMSCASFANCSGIIFRMPIWSQESVPLWMPLLWMPPDSALPVKSMSISSRARLPKSGKNLKIRTDCAKRIERDGSLAKAAKSITATRILLRSMRIASSFWIMRPPCRHARQPDDPSPD